MVSNLEILAMAERHNVQGSAEDLLYFIEEFRECFTSADDMREGMGKQDIKVQCDICKEYVDADHFSTFAPNGQPLCTDCVERV